MSKRKVVPHIFIETISSAVFIIIMGLVFLFQQTKEKTKFESETGNIISINHNFQELPFRDKEKFRYIEVTNYPRVFEVFVGKDPGDFTPALEKLDSLQKGDLITVYYDNPEEKDDKRINKLAQFIDKDNMPYFIRGSSANYLSYLIIAAGVIIAVLIFFLKKRGIVA